MVALLRRDRKIPISALTQSTAESADRCGECEWAFSSNYNLQDGKLMQWLSKGSRILEHTHKSPSEKSYNSKNQFDLWESNVRLQWREAQARYSPRIHHTQSRYCSISKSFDQLTSNHLIATKLNHNWTASLHLKQFWASFSFFVLSTTKKEQVSIGEMKILASGSTTAFFSHGRAKAIYFIYLNIFS